RLAALHLADEGGAGLLLEDLAPEQHDQLIAPQDSALAVDGADPVGVAVERDPQLRAGRLDPRDERLQVLGDGGIWMVIGEAPVRIAVDRLRLDPQLFEDGERREPPRAVAA